MLYSFHIAIELLSCISFCRSTTPVTSLTTTATGYSNVTPFWVPCNMVSYQNNNSNTRNLNHISTAWRNRGSAFTSVANQNGYSSYPTATTTSYTQSSVNKVSSVPHQKTERRLSRFLWAGSGYSGQAVDALGRQWILCLEKLPYQMSQTTINNSFFIIHFSNCCLSFC